MCGLKSNKQKNMKKVLVIYYSQSGQLLDIAKNITQDLDNSNDVDLNFYSIKLKNDFSFPWKRNDFFDAFPESFLQIPTELEETKVALLQKKYDLIILAYQVWYLTPSIPINSFLKNEAAKKVFANTSVITVIGCRNMWIMAQEKIKVLLTNNKAKLVGNIVLIDRHINHISVITTVKWMFSGVKKRYLGVFPKPGVSNQDIANSKRFGKIILEALKKNDFINLQNNLLKENAVKIKPFLVKIDKKANVIFNKWANLIIEKGKAKDPNRRFLLKCFNYYLLFSIWVIAPIVFILYLLTYPLNFNKIGRDKNYYSSIILKKT